MLEGGSSSHRFPSAHAPLLCIACKNGIHATGNQEEERPADELWPTQPGAQGLGVSDTGSGPSILPDLGEIQEFLSNVFTWVSSLEGFQVSLTVSIHSLFWHQEATSSGPLVHPDQR